MLRYFSHAKVFVIVILVALFAGLAFFGSKYDSPNSAVGGSKCVVQVYGRCYRQKEAERLSQLFWVARDLMMIDFAYSLFGEERRDQDTTDFVMSLIVLRKEAERLAIEPTAEEIKKAIPNLPIFGYRSWMDDSFVRDRILGPRGMTDSDLYQLVKDYLSWRKIQDLLEAGTQPTGIEVEKEYIRRYQQFTGATIEFDRKNYLDQVNITDEDIRKYYDDNQPKLPEDPVERSLALESLAENEKNLMSEEKRAYDWLKLVPPAENEKMTNEEKANQKLAFGNRVNEIYSALSEEGADFAALAKTFVDDQSDTVEATLHQAKAFPRTAPPEELKDQADLLDALFSRAIGAGEVTIPVKQEDGSYLLFKVAEVIEPQPLKFEEAREQIRKALIAKRSNTLVNEAALAAQSKMTAALEAGKSVADAAKEAGVEMKPLPPFSLENPPAGIDNASQIVVAAEGLSPHSVSEVLPLLMGKGYMILAIEKIELVESDEMNQRKRNIEVAAKNQYRRTLFNSWFDDMKSRAGIRRAGPVVNPEA